MRALVIGGTGPTGPHVLNGLLERGYDVAIMHRGVHEPPDLPDVEHIHGDPHFPETLGEAIGDAEYDVVLGMYGRAKVTAEFFAGRCGQLVCVTGAPAYQNQLEPWRFRPYGMKVNATEDSPLADTNGDPPVFSARLLAAERAVLTAAAAGAYMGTIVRYSAIYGARNIVPFEWSVIKRIRDGRPYILVTDGGLGITSRCAAQNAAHALMLIVDHPNLANGEAFNVADEDQFTLRQWIEMVTDIVGGTLDVISLPYELAEATFAELNPMPDNFPHTLVDISKIKNQLGYRDAISAIDATAEYVKWLEQNPPQPGEYPSYVDQFDYEADDRLLHAYRAACEQVLSVAGRPLPPRQHALPHPKAPGMEKDHKSR